VLTCNFKDNKPEIEPNQILYKAVKKEEEEEQKIDPKTKKPDPKAAAKKGAVEEEKFDENQMKIVYDVSKGENNFVEFFLHIVY
jgi:hypothetical protein